MSLSSYGKDKVCKLYIDSLSVEAFCQQQCALIELKPVQHVTDYTWKCKIRHDTKSKVYKAVVLSNLLYAREAWPVCLCQAIALTTSES